MKSTEDSGGEIHRCGTVSVKVEVECSMMEDLLYCPSCEVFWISDEDYWSDEETVWDISKPLSRGNIVNNLKAAQESAESLGKMVELKSRALKLSEAIQDNLMDRLRIEKDTVINHELEIEKIEAIIREQDHRLKKLESEGV